MHTLIKLDSDTTHFYSMMNEGFLFFFFNSMSVPFIPELNFLFQIKIKTKRSESSGAISSTAFPHPI